MKPGERIRLIQQSAESLSERPWHDIQLILRTFQIQTYEANDEWGPNPLAYCTQQLGDAQESVLQELHTYLLGEDADPTPPTQVDLPWGKSPVAVFISHCHEDAAFVGQVKELLATRYGIDAFVAHNDINPSRKWRDTIRSALASCHFMVAVLHERFHDSEWCDQEVGWALGRDIPVMPVRREAQTGKRHDGFLEEHQDLVLGPTELYGSSEWWLAEQIFCRVISDPKTRKQGISALAEAFVSSPNFDATRKLWAKISAVESWDSEQLRRLEFAVKTNRQVYEANLGPNSVPSLVAELVARFEPPPPEPQPTQDPWTDLDF